MENIKYSKDADNIVTLTIDMVGLNANIMNMDFQEAIEKTLADNPTKGWSRKDKFLWKNYQNELTIIIGSMQAFLLAID